ncbi:hypothetical protein P4S55_01320 [Shewanella sp. PP-Sp27a-2]
MKAALEQSKPPIIVAASTNNQAVTNIIDAFGKDFSEGEGALSGRWLPDITSYGAYFPSKSRLEEAEKAFKLKPFSLKLKMLIILSVQSTISCNTRCSILILTRYWYWSILKNASIRSCCNASQP